MKAKTGYSRWRIWVHIVLWALFFGYFMLPNVIFANGPWSFYFIFFFLLIVSAVYVNFNVLLKRFFVKEQYLKYYFSLLFLLIISSLLIWGLVELFLRMADLPEKTKVLKMVASSIGVFCVAFFLSGTVKIAKIWYLQYKLAKEKELEQAQAELQFLRHQLDPHFIFNALNNIYSLILNKSHKAADSVLMLSDLLQYMIYESSGQKVAVTQETEFLESYINLQRTRLNTEQKIYWSVNGSRHGEIAPLILFNFIENAFKHASGLITTPDGLFYIYIKIHADEHVLNLRVMNGIAKERKGNGDKRNGIGIQNAVKRLELLYSDSYELTIKEEKHIYDVHLKIPLS